MRKFVTRFASDVSGVADLEYGLIVAGIGLAIIAGVQSLGTSLVATFAEAGAAVSPSLVSSVSTVTTDVSATTALQYGAVAIGFAIATRAAARAFSRGRPTTFDNVNAT